MNGTAVNPLTIQPGQLIAAKFQRHDNGTITVTKTKKVNNVSFCSGSPEKVHLDHECHDSRFSTVIVPIKKD